VQNLTPSPTLPWLLLLLLLQSSNPVPAGTTLDLSNVLPSDTTHITYPGSLTTPPCTQGVLWHVMQTPLTISRGQVRGFKLNLPTGGSCLKQHVPCQSVSERLKPGTIIIVPTAVTPVTPKVSLCDSRLQC
jgi:hypothetical protein